MWDIPLAHNTGIIVNHWHTPLISPGVRHVMPGPGDGKWPSAPSYPPMTTGGDIVRNTFPILPFLSWILLVIARVDCDIVYQALVVSVACLVSVVGGNYPCWSAWALVWAGAHSASPRVSQAVQCRPGWPARGMLCAGSAGTETQWRGLPVSAGAHNMHQQDQLW